MEMELLKQIISINDGSEVDQQIVQEFNLYSLCRDGKYAFVGFVCNDKRLLISCPKHFCFIGEKDIKLIVRCIMKSFRQTDKGSTEYVNCNIPYKAYLYILDYYHSHGLYKEKIAKHGLGYSGNIDWDKTVRRSERVISGGNLLYLPFSIKKTVLEDNFIGECMRYVINDGYIQFGQYAGIGELIDRSGYSINFKNKEYVIKQLKEEEGKHFKDIEIQLIRALMMYFKWDGSLNNGAHFITQSFDLSWECMVQHYLNCNYFGYDEETQRIIFKSNSWKYFFTKQMDYIESRDKNNHCFSVAYDHFLNSKSMSKVLVFDSKYYNKISELNYKQVAYHYFLMNDSKGNKRNAEDIINGLVLPTDNQYTSCVHVDRRNIDGIYIQEHYLNLREVMEQFVYT